MHASTPSRRDDIDWLRVGATYLLFVFHGAMVFNPAPFYHIRNADLSLGMLVLCGFIGLWQMPLFFLLAGWSTQASLAVRGTRGYLRERVWKLLIPLCAGVALFGPIIKFIELKSGLDLNHAGLRVSTELQESFRMVIPSPLAVAPPFHETFLEFLPTFFTRLDRFSWSHLWFIAYLFTFSLLYLPLIVWLGRRAPRLKQPGVLWVYAPAVPLAVIQLTLRERWPGIQNLYNDWANVAYYSVYLLAGVILGSQPALERVVHREWKRALLVGAAVSGLLLSALLRLFTAPWVVLAGSALAGWCFVIALLGLGRAFRPSARLELGYLRESAFPVYILHQVAIVLSGYAIIQLPLGIGAKFALILVASVSSTLAVYHFVVRRSTVIGVCFGTKPKLCPLPPRPGSIAAAGIVLVLVASSTVLAMPGLQARSGYETPRGAPPRSISARGEPAS
ncbi:MAG: acyltransferase family protein [Candidatus Binatia bacterium]